MLTRLTVNGFKNLVNVDVRFGPFTCIAGPNGVGKSNLFDAIAFLSDLADKSLLDAARSVRDREGRSGDIRNLFYKAGENFVKRMSFEAEMIIPKTGQDDLGVPANATHTFLVYRLEVVYREPDDTGSLGAIEVAREDLTYIEKGEAHSHLPFRHSATGWRRSVVAGRRASPFISTKATVQGPEILLHLDKGRGGRPLSFKASSLPRTVLSSSTASESPTALLARKEMRSWQILQLEPTALRRPDSFGSSSHLSADGSHLPAALYRLARNGAGARSDSTDRESYREQIYAQVANRLSELIDDVRELWVESDPRRELLVLQARMKDGTVHPAMSLSDGTLRFLALTVLSIDPEVTGVLCLEEPENGIHPARITSMIDLLHSICVDVMHPDGPDNPLRQVLINTHSPSFVAQVAAQDLLFVEIREAMNDKGEVIRGPSFGCVSQTWRSGVTGTREASRGTVLRYLGVAPSESPKAGYFGEVRTPRLIDRKDIQLSLFNIQND